MTMYFDSTQLDQILLPNISKNLNSLMHVNAGSLVANIENVCLNLASLKHKFSVVAVTETWTNSSIEKTIDIPGYDKIIKSRENRVGGGVALFIDSDLNVKIKARHDLDCQNSSIW